MSANTGDMHVRATPRGRYALIALGGISLLVGLDAALLLADLPAPVTAERLLSLHGPLMVLGFLGTLISLERAVAIRASWAYLAPVGTGLGALVLLSPLPVQVGQVMQLAGLGVLMFIYARAWQRQTSIAIAVQWMGALMAVIAAALWLFDVETGVMLPWLAGFLILTIAGERLELAHVAAPPPSASRLLLGLAAGLILAAIAALLWPAPGVEIYGAVVVAIALWLLRFDIATKTVRATGLPRYSAVNMLFGIGWLLVAGAIWLLFGMQTDGPAYDLVIHAVGLGFAMSMVLAHAPIILPAVLQRSLPYRPVLYASTVLLQGSLIMRAFGDLRDIGWAWQSGAAANVAALLLFLVTAVVLVVRK